MNNNSLAIIYLQESIHSAQEALRLDNDAKKEALDQYQNARNSLARVRMFSNDNNFNCFTSLLITTYEKRIKQFAAHITVNEEQTLTLPQQHSLSNVGKVENQWNLNCIVGMQNGKRILLESIVIPRKFPHLYSGTRPINRILLFGPPGTGKTKLVQAIAGESGLNVISTTPADLLSKWFGTSERQIKKLFEEATNQDAIIFFDEIDSLLMKRTDNEDENTRRIKNEFLIQLDNLSPNTPFIACTNRPWDLDSALLRRFQKKVYVPLPSAFTREKMFRLYLQECNFLEDADFQELACKTEGLSGSDIAVACQSALETPIRDLMVSTHFKEVSSPSVFGKRTLLPCSPQDSRALKINLMHIDTSLYHVVPNPIQKSDIWTIILSACPSVLQDEVANFSRFASKLNDNADAQ